MGWAELTQALEPLVGRGYGNVLSQYLSEVGAEALVCHCSTTGQLLMDLVG